MNVLSTDRLCIVREGRALLSNVSLQLHPGELHVLLGPNGAGKSTLHQALSGELVPTSGQIQFGRDDLSQLSPLQLARRRAVLPQQDGLAFGFSVKELALLGRHAAIDQRPSTTRQVLTAVLQAMDLSHLAARRYLQLSGGERRRAQIARVLAQVWDVPNAVLLLDEPTHSLDFGHQHAVLALLRQLAQQGFSILASLHDLNLTAAYAQRVSLLHAGHLVASGSPEAVLTEPKLQSIYGDSLRFTAVPAPTGQQWLIHQDPAARV